MAKGTAVIYARFSCSKQREASIDDQLKECKRWCAENGYSVVGKYCDYAMSGRTDERPQFQAMIANAGESDVIVVYMMDRFSRDVYDATIYKKKLRDMGVSVISATQQLPDGPEARLIESIYEAMAEMESANTARRVIRGMTGNAEKCMHNGVSVYGYDWGEDGRYVVNEEQAEIVREVFARRVAGETTYAIANDLAARGVKSYRGFPCGKSMVRWMLRNERYIGTYSWRDVRVEHGMPAIVDEETFAAAQAIRGRPMVGKEEWHEYVLTGRMVCTRCGGSMHGTAARNSSGRQYLYYRCDGGCGLKKLRVDWVEPEIADRIRAILGDRDVSLEIAKEVASSVTDDMASARLSAARKSLEDAGRGIANIMRAVEAGMDYADVADRLGQLKEQRAQAELDIATWRERAEIDVESLADFLSTGAGMDDRELIDAFVWQVQVSNEGVSVVLTYDTGGKPTGFDVPRVCADGASGRPDVNNGTRVNGVNVSYRDGLLSISFGRKGKR